MISWFIVLFHCFLSALCSKCGICYGNMAGWLSVCLSHAGIVSKG